MSIKKELKKAYLKLTGQYRKKAEVAALPNSLHIPYETFVVNVISEEDLKNNEVFINKMRKTHFNTPPQSILCFLPYGVDAAFLAGGYRTILALNNALSVGWKAKIYLCFFPITEGEQYTRNFNMGMQKYFPETEYEIISYSKVFDLSVDIAMCNFWLGAYPLIKFNNCKEKYNLVQDHEANFYESGIVSTLAERTLTFGFYKIVNSGALLKYVEFIDKDAKAYRYLPGTDKNIYYPVENKKFDKKTYKIIFYGRPSVPRNAFALLAVVFKNVKIALSDRVEIISVGEEYDVKDVGLEGIVTNLGKLKSLDELGALYRECDIGVSLITTPTFSYQHLEYMSSGLCLVTNNQEGISDFLQDGINAVVCEPTVDIMITKIINLINNVDSMQKISKAGQEFVQTMDWDKCFDGIMKFILSDKR